MSEWEGGWVVVAWVDWSGGSWARLTLVSKISLALASLACASFRLATCEDTAVSAAAVELDLKRQKGYSNVHGLVHHRGQIDRCGIARTSVPVWWTGLASRWAGSPGQP